MLLKNAYPRSIVFIICGWSSLLIWIKEGESRFLLILIKYLIL
jgi:hypothetical protein